MVLLPNVTFGNNLQDIADRVVANTKSIGINVVIRFIGDDLRATVDSILRLRPMAVLNFGGILAVEQVDRLIAHRIIVAPRATNPDATSFYALPDRIGECQVDALLSRGPRKIYYATLADRRSDDYGPLRQKGVARASQRRGQATPLAIAVPLDLAGAVAVLEAIASPDVPIGIACYNDAVALAILAAARQLNLDVPGRVSVVGMDNTEVGQLWSPRLTTVHVDTETIVDNVVKQLFESLELEPPSFSGDLSSLVHAIPGDTA